METVWKFILDKQEADQLVDMPYGAKPFSAGNQKERLVVWAIVEPDNRPSPVRILLAGAGHPLPLPSSEMGEFLGTAQFAGGDHVFHIYHKLDLN